jgi:hypothetical protein
MSGLFDIQDLFAVGLGFDISGGYLVAHGLLLTPRDVARLSSTYIGFNPHEAVARSRDRIDVMFGLFFLLLGFALQALGYVLSVGGFCNSEPSTGKAITAVALVGAVVVLSQWIARLTRQHILLGYLVNVARQDDDGTQVEYPLDERIVPIAKVLGFEAGDDEDALALAQRVFGKRHVKDLLVKNGSDYRRVSDLRKEKLESRSP